MIIFHPEHEYKLYGSGSYIKLYMISASEIFHQFLRQLVLYTALENGCDNACQ